MLPKDTAQSEGDGQRQVTESILSQDSGPDPLPRSWERRANGDGAGRGGAAQRAPAERRRRAGTVRAVGARNPPPPRGGGMVPTHDSTLRNKNWRKRKDGMIKSFWSFYQKILQERKTV